MLRRSVNVSLTPEEAEALGKWAEAECRDPREQARYFIRKGLGLGLVPSSADDDAGEGDEPINEAFGTFALGLASDLKKAKHQIMVGHLMLAGSVHFIRYNKVAAELYSAYTETSVSMVAAIDKCDATLTRLGVFCVAMEPDGEDGED